MAGTIATAAVGFNFNAKFFRALTRNDRPVCYRGGFDDFSDNRIRKIPADRKNRLQMAIAVYNQRAEVVVDQSSVGLVLDARPPGEFGDFGRRAGQKTPVFRVIFITVTVSFQHRRSVEFRSDIGLDESAELEPGRAFESLAVVPGLSGFGGQLRGSAGRDVHHDRFRR